MPDVCTEMPLYLGFIISNPKYEGKWNYVERTYVKKRYCLSEQEENLNSQKLKN